MLPPDRCGGDKTMGPGNVGPSVLMKAAFIPAVNGFCVEWNYACPRPNPSRAGEAKLDPWGEILQHRGWWQVVADRPHGATMRHCSPPHLGCLQHPRIYEVQPQPQAGCSGLTGGGCGQQRGRGQCPAPSPLVTASQGQAITCLQTTAGHAMNGPSFSCSPTVPRRAGRQKAEPVPTAHLPGGSCLIGV